MSGPDLEDPRRQTGAAGPSPMRRPPQLRAGGDDEHRHASWLELFFDLVFVAVVFQVGETLAEHHDAAGYLEFVGVFTIVAWSWMCFTYFANRFDTDDVPQRILMSLAMLAVAGLGVAVGDQSEAWSQRFAIAQVGVHVVLLALYLRARLHVPAARASIDRYLVGFGLGAVVWLASAMVDTPLRYVLWGAALAIEVATPLLSWGVLARLPVDREHLRERFGLFTIIVLGEAVLAVVIGTQDARWAAPAITTTVGRVPRRAGALVGLLRRAVGGVAARRALGVRRRLRAPAAVARRDRVRHRREARDRARGGRGGEPGKPLGARRRCSGPARRDRGVPHRLGTPRARGALDRARACASSRWSRSRRAEASSRRRRSPCSSCWSTGISLAIEAISVREAGGHVWALAAAAVQPPEPPFRPPAPSPAPD